MNPQQIRSSQWQTISSYSQRQNQSVARGERYSFGQETVASSPGIAASANNPPARLDSINCQTFNARSADTRWPVAFAARITLMNARRATTDFSCAICCQHGKTQSLRTVVSLQPRRTIDSLWCTTVAWEMPDRGPYLWVHTLPGTRRATEFRRKARDRNSTNCSVFFIQGDP